MLKTGVVASGEHLMKTTKLVQVLKGNERIEHFEYDFIFYLSMVDLNL